MWTKDFRNITYLEKGNDRQKQAFRILTQYKVLEKLHKFNPILVGTIPINIDIEGSDLDIICQISNKEDFKLLIEKEYSNNSDFKLWENTKVRPHAVVCSFKIDEFEIEIFGQDKPTEQQFAYRHMLIEHRLLEEKGEAFRQRIIELKNQGYKTEPAFAKELGLEGDPYFALLELVS
jgi:hypothetical protein